MSLSQYRVLDLTDDRGQFASFLLAELGADVVLVEPPEGSRSRLIGPFIDDEPGPDRSLFHWSYNRGKRSAVIESEQLDTLVAEADVVIGCVEDSTRLAAWRERHPALVTAAVTAFGSDGPKAEWHASDLTIAAAGGVMSVTGDQDRPPIRIGHPQSWLVASADATTGILIALRERTTSGLGQHVDVSAQQ